MSAPSGSIKMIGNWKKDMDVSLGWALNTTYDVAGRSIAEATKHAIILMAKSLASARTGLTKKSKKNRKIERDEKKRPYIAKLEKDGGTKRWYLPNKKHKPDEYARLLSELRPIGNQGLARHSWLWGLKGLKVSANTRKPMPGVSTMRRLVTKTVGGYILTNRLSYIRKALAPGWKQTVQRLAANKIMKQAQMKMKSKWERELRRFGTRKAAARQPDLAKYFMR